MSPRGAGFLFGGDVVEQFNHTNRSENLISFQRNSIKTLSMMIFSLFMMLVGVESL